MDPQLDESPYSLTAADPLVVLGQGLITPLQGILGLSRSLLPDPPSPQVQHQLALLQSAVHHMLRVSSVATLRAHAPQMSLRGPITLLDLSALLHDVCALTSASVADPGHTLLCQAEAFWCEADALGLRQLLFILLGHAVTCTHPGPILVSLVGGASRGAHGHAVIDVFCTGSERLAPGAGAQAPTLGLRVATQLCHAMGGELTCESGQGFGGHFRCALPVLAAHPPDEAPMQARPDNDARTVASPEVVLLVERDRVCALVMRTALEQLGWAVVHAPDAQTALAFADVALFDLVIVDNPLPDMSAQDLVERLRQQELERATRPATIFAFTPQQPPRWLADRPASGVDAWLCKPFDLQALLRAVSACRQGNSTPPMRAAMVPERLKM